MRAVVLNGAGQLETTTLPRPECGPGEVLLQVSACGLPADGFEQGTRQVPGHEIAGVIAEVGLGVPSWKPGSRLALGGDVHCGVCHYCRHGLFNLCNQLRRLGRDLPGGMSEYVLLSREVVDHGIINKIPEGLSFVHASMADLLSPILAIHEDLAIARLETVAVMNCGIAGILHSELLQGLEANVILVDSSATLLQRAEREFDVEATIDSSKEDVVKAVVELTEGLGADVVLVMTRWREDLGRSAAMVRKRGRIALLGGVLTGGVLLDAGIHRREVRLFGSYSYHPNYHARALETLASGAVRCDRFASVYRMEEAAGALHEMRSGTTLKAVIVPG